MTLKKRLNGLGFSFFITELDTSLDSGSIVRIRTLFPDQPADESGKIREGDVILSINGEPLKGRSYQVTKERFFIQSIHRNTVKTVTCEGPGFVNYGPVILKCTVLSEKIFTVKLTLVLWPLTPQQVLQLLRKSPSEVTLLLCRPAQGTREWPTWTIDVISCHFGHL